jgi:hypothetical protein
MVGWNTFDLAPGPVMADGSDIAAVSMFPGHMETFFVAPDGQVIDYFWRGGWDHFSLAPPGSAASGGIAAVSRSAAFMEVWWIGPSGSVEGRFFVDGQGPGTGWNHYTLAPAGRAAPGSKIRAISKFPGHMEVFWISPIGSIEGAFWLDDGKAWRFYRLAPEGSAVVHSGLTAVTREPKAMEIWWVAQDGSVQGAWEYDVPGWNRYTLAPTGSAVVGAGLRAQARLPNVLNVWWISPSGSVEGSFEVLGPNQKWTRYQIAGNGSASLQSGLFSLHRLSSTEEIF